MGVREISGKWHTVNAAGKVGKRGFSTKANAEAAQARGLALAPRIVGTVPAVPSTSDVDAMDTAEERKALGIAPKKARPDPESF